MTPIAYFGFQDPVSSLSHLLAAVLAVFGGFLLVRRGHGHPARTTSLVVYSIAQVFLFSMSGVFHLLDRGTEARDVLQRLDHAGIWVLIAGTFTPLHVILFRGHKRWLVLTIVWVLAITALVLEVVFFSDFPEYLLLSLLLGLGWIGAFSAIMFRKTYRDASLKWLAAGGILYSIGAVIDFTRWPVLIDGILGPHEIFHLFVFAAALSHWIFIFHWCAHPVDNSITFDVVTMPGNRIVARSLREKIEIQANSIDEAKELIRQRVRQKFHETIQPAIRICYRQEEQL